MEDVLAPVTNFQQVCVWFKQYIIVSWLCNYSELCLVVDIYCPFTQWLSIFLWYSSQCIRFLHSWKVRIPRLNKLCFCFKIFGLRDKRQILLQDCLLSTHEWAILVFKSKTQGVSIRLACTKPSVGDRFVIGASMRSWIFIYKYI